MKILWPKNNSLESTLRISKAYKWHFEGLKMSNMVLKREKNGIVKSAKNRLFPIHAGPRTSYAPLFLPVSLLLPTHHFPKPLPHQPLATHKLDHSQQLS